VDEIMQALELRANHMNESDYEGALEFIYSYVDYGSEPVSRYSPESFELGRIRQFMGEFGDPHLDFPAVHIAGTKGKGSVAALVANTLTRAGYRAGLYTSPHLIRFNERIQIDGRHIPDRRFVEIVEKLKPVAQRNPDITTYELMTALAFIHFQEERVDVAVFEVGLGGRLDATNIVQPLATAITSISLDHTQILGETVAEIAAEKGGIIKTSVPVVLSPQVPEAHRVLQTIAHQFEAPVQIVGEAWGFERLEQTNEGQSFSVWSEQTPPEDHWIPLLGQHQVENAATARALIEIMKRAGFEIPLSAIREGFASLRWPGRFHIIQHDPMVVLDACHNADAAGKLGSTFKEVFPGRELILVFGASADKDIRGMLDHLGPLAKRIITTMALHPRAARTETLLGLARPLCEEVESVVPVRSAVELGLSYASAGEVLLITGSLFVVGEALTLWIGQGEARQSVHPRMETS
jgi:dihydrofolate synthase/folylpolyglutamate synthase